MKKKTILDSSKSFALIGAYNTDGSFEGQIGGQGVITGRKNNECFCLVIDKTYPNEDVKKSVQWRSLNAVLKDMKRSIPDPITEEEASFGVMVISNIENTALETLVKKEDVVLREKIRIYSVFLVKKIIDPLFHKRIVWKSYESALKTFKAFVIQEKLRDNYA